MPLLEATIIPEDVGIIQSLAISRFGRPDSMGWHFTKNGRYTVKSGYMVEQLFPDKNIMELELGPTITSLQAFVWQIKCPPKIQHFIWQAISGCVSVGANLKYRRINCDIQCSLCGCSEETINHVLFECPPAIQTWALSMIPTNPDNFPNGAIYSNMDYLFHGIPKDNSQGFFPWIIWYLWKNRNDKVFNNKIRNPQDILILAETEGKAWEAAQEMESNIKRDHLVRVEHCREDIWRCQLDGSWKTMSKFSGQGWFCAKNGSEEQLYGSRNIRSSQSPLHAELEALIWAMECMIHTQRLDVVFATDSQDVVKMVSSPEEWPAFAVHLDEVLRRKSSFQEVRIVYIPRMENVKADALARRTREMSTEMVYVGHQHPSWDESS